MVLNIFESLGNLLGGDIAWSTPQLLIEIAALSNLGVCLSLARETAC